MATTITSRGKVYLGPSMMLEYGDFSSTDTTAATLQVSGGAVITSMFFDGSGNLCGSAGTTATVVLSSKSLSGNVTSITVTPGGAIAGGSYLVMHGGS